LIDIFPRRRKSKKWKKSTKTCSGQLVEPT
jgi:hypothetical protein